MINISYKVSSEQWIQGWEKYYDTFRFKGQVIRAAIFLVPLILFVEQVIKDPSYGAGWICIVICLLSMAVLLLSKFTEKRNYIKLLEVGATDTFTLSVADNDLMLIKVEEGQNQTVTVEDDNVSIEGELADDADLDKEELSDIPPMKCDLSDKLVKAFESDEFFGIFSDILSCVIPKSQLSEEDASSLREALKKAMDKRFVLC